jgi:hypothetical protein
VEDLEFNARYMDCRGDTGAAVRMRRHVTPG